MKTSEENILNQLRWRYSVKLFDLKKKISKSSLSCILDSLVLTPSSYGMQPWKFFVISDREELKKLTTISFNQKQVESCSHLIVLVAKTQITEEDIDAWIQRLSRTPKRDVSELASYREKILSSIGEMKREKQGLWAKNQVYIALGQLLSIAAMLEIDACPMEGISRQDYDKYLNLDSSFSTVVICPLGYRSPEDKYAEFPKVRFSKEKIIKEKSK